MITTNTLKTHISSSFRNLYVTRRINCTRLTNVGSIDRRKGKSKQLFLSLERERDKPSVSGVQQEARLRRRLRRGASRRVIVNACRARLSSPRFTCWCGRDGRAPLSLSPSFFLSLFVLRSYVARIAWTFFFLPPSFRSRSVQSNFRERFFSLFAFDP